jgi:hypothetical protein
MIQIELYCLALIHLIMSKALEIKNKLRQKIHIRR